MNNRLSTAVLSAVFAVYVGIAAGCGGGGDGATAVADTAGASKPSAAAGNNGNGKKKGGSSVSVSSQLTAVGDTQGVYKTGVYVVMMKGDPAVMVEAEGRSGKYNPNSAAL